MIYKSIQNNKFNILLFGAILIFIKNKKTKIYFFTHNPVRILFSFIPILSNIARIYPRYFEVTEDAIIISYLNKSLVYFKDYEIPKVLNYRFLSPAINYKKKEIIFGDYINLGFFLKRPKTQNIHIRKFDGKTLKSIISIRNIKHIHNIEYVNDKEIIYSTGDSAKESKIAKCIKEAQLENFVQDKKKLDTYVGELGSRLSGGQKQRIGIARSLYNDPQVLVLDEFTNALDSSTEDKILGQISNLNKKTIIMISHKLTTLSKCDKVYELSKSGLKLI